MKIKSFKRKVSITFWYRYLWCCCYILFPNAAQSWGILQAPIYKSWGTCKSWKGLTLDLLTLGDPVDGYGVGDLHHGVEDGGDHPGEEGDYHCEAEDSE